MKKNGFLDSIRVASPCSQDWEEMSGSDKVRFCGHCALKVNNLSAMTRKEAMRVVRESEGRICVRYVKNPETNAPVFTDKLYQITRRAGIAAGVLGASLTLSTLTYAQGNCEAFFPKEQCQESSKKQSDKDKTKIVTGTISGTVTDSNGAVVPNATITVSNEKTNETRAVTTNDEGSYEIENAAPGTYRLKANAGGFIEKSVVSVEVTEGKETPVNISLDVRPQMVMMGDVAFIEYEQPLSKAVANDKSQDVKDLIARGANVNAKDKNYGETTALHVAVENGNQEIARYLLDMGAKINARDKQRRTPLMAIDYDATPELVRMLLDYKAKVNAFDTEGNTTLIFAAGYENAEILRVLIDAGAAVNAQNKEGKTALMLAAENGYLENLKVLLEAGADVNLRDKDNKTALDLSDDEEIKELLKSYNAKE